MKRKHIADPIGVQKAKKTKNRKFKKPYIKLVLDSKKWDSDRWDGWEIILGFIPPFFPDPGPAKRREHYFVCYFLNIVFVIFSILSQIQNGTSLRKINSGSTTPGTASKSQCHNIVHIFLNFSNFVNNGQLVFKP